MIPATITTANIGDVWAVNTGNALASELIRIGAALEGKPAGVNHVVGVVKVDQRHVWWGIEGRPGGVAWADLRHYQNAAQARLGNTNAGQPKTPEQRAGIATGAKLLLGDAYDWAAITDDTASALHLPEVAEAIQHLWDRHGTNLDREPVVCSSLYAFLYVKLSIPSPANWNGKDWDAIEPADWWAWNASEGWK